MLVDKVQEALRSRLESSLETPVLRVGGEVVRSRETLMQFYESRRFVPYWTNERGIRPLSVQFEEALQGAGEEGLNSADYHLEEIRRFHQRLEQGDSYTTEPAAIADFELLLTDGFLTFGLHLLNGRVKPEDLEPDWIAKPRAANLLAALDAADKSGDLRSELDRFQPRAKAYSGLMAALARYRQIRESGGWDSVPEGTKLELGMSDPRIPALRKRLLLTADLKQGATENETLFDAGLDEAVRGFQRRHGLDIDGVVGRKTFEALNVSVDRRIAQIELNLERWRWLPEDLGRTHVIVNIAGFHLEVIEDDHVVLEMPVVVGRPYRRTPVFSDQLTYLVFNPYWQVPPTLAVQDIVPKILADPGYLTQEKMRVFAGWGSEMKEVDPSTVDWKKARNDMGSLRFRQDPGPTNALGRVKFMFPNKFNVYLHDTPTRSLFAKSDRAFSSGCIRLARPLDLALFLLGSSDGWSIDRIQKVLETNTEETVLLPRRIPIHLLYWTAWVEEDVTMPSFRTDIYGRDERLEKALAERLVK